MEEQTEFKQRYCNIPVEVYANRELSKTCILVYSLIHSLDDPKKHCWASNGYLAAVLGVSADTIGASISILKKEGYIEVLSFDGRTRTIKIVDCVETKFKYIYEEQEKRIEEYRSEINQTSSGPGEQTRANNRGRPGLTPERINKEDKEREFSFSREEVKISSLEEGECQSQIGIGSSELNNDVNSNPVKMKRRSSYLQNTIPAEPEKSYRDRISEGVLKASKSLPEIKYTAKPKQITKTAREVIEYWEESGLRKIYSYQDKPRHFNETITLVNAVYKGNRPFSRKFSMEEIKRSIHRFSLVAIDSEFEPADPVKKKDFAKLHLKDFLFNSFAKMRSWFIYYVSNEPRTIVPIVEDLYPKSTNIIRKFYTEYVFGGMPQKYSLEEENKFRIASIKAKEFYDKNKYNLRGINGFSEIVQMLCEAVKQHWGEEVSKVSPGCFCSDFAISKLKSYLNEQGVVECSGRTIYRSSFPNENYL